MVARPIGPTPFTVHAPGRHIRPQKRSDNATAIVPIVPIIPEDAREGAGLLPSPGVIAALRALFEQIREQAHPLGGSGRRDPHGLGSQERELLRLLAEGLTDERAGQRLGVSLRTVRRMTADLMVRMDARSRFRAGIQVAALGRLGGTTSRWACGTAVRAPLGRTASHRARPAHRVRPAHCARPARPPCSVSIPHRGMPTRYDLGFEAGLADGMSAARDMYCVWGGR
ncbi:helix-turn-helix transcriptional regulator [Kitasatospora sp. NPDC003701]